MVIQSSQHIVSYIFTFFFIIFFTFSRIKEKYENELKDMERSERNARDLYNETRSKLAECEANKQNIQSTVKQLEIQLVHAQKVNLIDNNKRHRL